MSYIGENHINREGTNTKPVAPPFPDPAVQPLPGQEQSPLLALTSQWGHSVFELNNPRGHSDNHQIKHPAEAPYRKSNFEELDADEIQTRHYSKDARFVEPINLHRQDLHRQDLQQQDLHRQDLHTTNTLSAPPLPLQEELKVEQAEQCDGEYIAPRDWRPQQENANNKDQEVQNPELSSTQDFHSEQEVEDLISETETLSSTDRKLRCCKRGRLSDEQILEKRAAQASAQREVRRRRRQKMSEEELENHRASVAASQREARKRQKERMSNEELQVRRAVNAIAQREIRKRKHKNMSDEELKAHRAREAARQKELRMRKRMEMTEEQLKEIRAREAAASAARRMRRLEKESAASCITGEEPDPSPS